MTVALTAIHDRSLLPAAPSTTTLLGLVTELSRTCASDQDVVAAVMDLLEARRVTLIGEIREEHLLSEPRPTHEGRAMVVAARATPDPFDQPPLRNFRGSRKISEGCGVSPAKQGAQARRKQEAFR